MMGGPGGQTGGPAGMNRPVAGDIIASDDKSITVKLQDGSSKIVLVNDQSTVTEATTSTKQSLSVGKKVLVFGTANSDGSVTAQNVQLNPQGNMMMFGQNRPNGGNGQGR
jgi:beta-lactamase superfamily II metal-dependent hydrolase